MKIITLIAFVFFMSAVTNCFAAEQSTNLDHEQIRYEEDKKELSMLKAVEDLDAHTDFMLRMRNNVDEANALGWDIFVADKIPSQPIAVIRLLAKLEEPELDRMCPRIVIEDMMDDTDYDVWMERAIRALSSFKMVDAKEEGIRQVCLENIKKSLAKSPLRQKQ